MQLNANKSGCYYISFPNRPNYFELRDANGDIYHFRYCRNTPRIKFNIPDPGVYTTNVPFTLVDVKPIEIPTTWPELPPPERDRWPASGVSKIEYNPAIKGTPVRIFTEEGVIETGNRFYEYPPVLRLFLLLHETGHYFYLTEEYCDLWALINYLRMGYNRSMAFFALNDILSRNAHNLNRVMYLFNNIQKTQAEPLL